MRRLLGALALLIAACDGVSETEQEPLAGVFPGDDVVAKFVEAWNAGDLARVVAFKPDHERAGTLQNLLGVLKKHGYQPLPQIQRARGVPVKDGEVLFREAGRDKTKPVVLTVWERWRSDWVLRTVKVRKRQ